MKILNMNNSFLVQHMIYILAEQFNCKIKDVKFIGGGSYGKVFRAVLNDGRVIALKAFRNDGNQAKEAAQVKLLSKHTSVEMPKILFEYSNSEIAFIGMSFIEGCNALNPALLFKSYTVKSAFAESVVNGMLEWHSVKNEKFGDLDNPIYSTWSEYYINEKQKPVLNELAKLVDKGKFSRKNLDFLLEATEVFNKYLSEPESAILIHGDLNIMNIMVNPKTMELKGFIDPSGSAWADREYDLFQFRNMWGDCYGLYDTYKSKVKISEYTDFRVAYYAAINEASCRLKGALVMPLWEIQCNSRLKKEMSKLK